MRLFTVATLALTCAYALVENVAADNKEDTPNFRGSSIKSDVELNKELTEGLHRHLSELQFNRHLADDLEDVIHHHRKTHSILKGQSTNLFDVTSGEATMQGIQQRHSKRNNAKRGNNKRNKNGKRGNKKNGNKLYNAGGNGRPSNGGKRQRYVCTRKPDPYRTCFQRAVDPYSGVYRDTIARNRYNYGVKLYKQGYTWYPSKGKGSVPPPVKPYRRPYTRSNEELVSDLMWIPLLQDDTKVDCDSMIQFEEAALTYLADNVGDEYTFQPMCVFVQDSAYHEQDVIGDSGDMVMSTVLEVEVTYVVQRGAQRWTRGLEEEVEFAAGDDEKELERDLIARCTSIDKAQCCSQSAINGDIGKYCQKKGCNANRCGKGRRTSPRELGEENIEGDTEETTSDRELRGMDFNDAVRRQTPFQPDDSWTLLKMDDLEAVATCSANRYSVEEYDTPALTCEDFEGSNCGNENDDLLPELDEENGGCDEGDEKRGRNKRDLFR